MGDPYNPEPRPFDNLAEYVGQLTCQNCAGTGKLTTSTTLVYLGREHKQVTVRRCEPCNGWGVQGAGERR